MRFALSIFVFLLCVYSIEAQEHITNRSQATISQSESDKAQVDALVQVGRTQSVDSAFQTLQKALTIANEINYTKGAADSHLLLQGVYAKQGNFSKAIQSNLVAASLYEQINNHQGAASAHGMLQALYREVGDYRTSLSHAFQALQLAEKHNIIGGYIFSGHRWAPLMLAEIGQTYVLMQQLDSAFFYTKKSINQKELFNGAEWEFPIYLMATIQSMKGQYQPALEGYRKALALCVPNQTLNDTIQIFSGLSTLFKNMNQPDSAIHYAQIVARGWNMQSEYKNLLEALTNLAQVYKSRGNKDSALKYAELSFATKDSIFSAEKNREVQWMVFNAKLKEEELEADEIRYKSKLQLQVFIAGLLMLFVILAILWRSNRHKQEAKAKVEVAYEKLQATQQQLIQAEKMASLGELTAGIAHEIQNPLNFVNNFSETNKELIDELQAAAQAGTVQEVIALASDIRANEEKIAHHGKRADAIVKGMLQHARTSSGEKQPTDINSLVDEYLRLSFQGMRAKDKAFSAAIETHFDDSLGAVNIVPQDIGRVLLNLFNNAFYAVSKKKEQLNGTYEPIITVITKRKGDQITITVKDNGIGMSQKVAEKVFQPFFTTKPTGEGTGLGLSLSYDIITKGHGGNLSVSSKEGEGAEFVVQLPTA